MIRKLIAAALAAAVILSLAACSGGGAGASPSASAKSGSGRLIMEFCGEQAFGATTDDPPAEKAIIHRLDEGAGMDWTFTDKKAVKELFAAVSQITVGDKTDEKPDGDETTVTFVTGDDTDHSFTFSGELLCSGGEFYKTSGAAALDKIIKAAENSEG